MRFVFGSLVLLVELSAALLPEPGQAPEPRVVPKQAGPQIHPGLAYTWAAADAVALRASAEKAAADAERTGDHEQAKEILAGVEQTRYLFLGNLPAAEWAEYEALCNVALNSISLRKTMAFVAPVPGSDGALLRVPLYELDPGDQGLAKLWDELGAKGSGPVPSVKKVDEPEPYFHARVRVAGSKSVKEEKTRKVHKTDANGQKLYQSVNGKLEPLMVDEPYTETKTVPGGDKFELKHQGFLDPAAVEALTLALKTDFPVLRADWFLVNGLQAPAYNRWFNLKKLDDVYRVARFRRQDDDLLVKGVVSDSDEVAIHQRAARFTPTSLGFISETDDFFTSVNEDDLLEDLRLRRRDASEVIWSLPNGLQGYALVNDSAKNDVIDFADPNVAADTRTPLRSKLVWTAWSCMVCHDAGLKPVTDEVRLLANDNVALLAKRRADFKAVVDQFSTPIEEPVTRGQVMYARAIQLSSRGKFTPKAFAAFLQRAIVRYVQDPLTMEVVAAETGATPEQIVAVLERLRGNDHTLAQLYKKRPVRRDQFAYGKGFTQLMAALAQDAAQRKQAGQK